MPKLGLEYLSVFGLDPVEFIHIAGELGCSAIGLNLSGGANAFPGSPETGFRHAPERRRAIAGALRDTGLSLALVEGFAITPETAAADFARDLDHVADMGAAAICCISIDRDRPRTQAQFWQLAEMAAERSMVVTTEVGAGILRNLPAALEIVAAVDHPAFGLLIDTMHFFRSGSTVADFAAIDPALVRHIQLCDVPMPAVIDNYMEEALFERRAPGDGDLPLAQLVRVFPAHATIGLEIPIRSLAKQGMAHRERLDLCIRKARRLWSASETARG